MRHLSLSLITLIAMLIVCQCAKFGSTDYSDKTPIFPDTSETLGKVVADDLRKTVINLHRKGADYSDADASEAFYNRFLSEYISASPGINTKASITEFKTLGDPAVFIQGYKNLTEIQLSYVDKIISKTKNSESYESMRLILVEISDDIRNNVPLIQQERLFNIVATLYYCSSELQYLEEQGLMPRTPQSILTAIKTRSEGSSSGSCRDLLLTAWALAALEPTLVGETIVSVVAVYIGLQLLYEVIICKDASYEENREECIDLYEMCANAGLELCDDCMQYCITQGYWPYDRCRM